MRYDELARKAQTNHEGAKAEHLPAEMDLYSAVATSMLFPLYYEGDASERVERIATLIERCEPLFVAKLAVYARTVLNMRSVPLLMTVELARHHQGDGLVSRMAERVIERADELAEMLACYQWRNPWPQGIDTGKKLGHVSSQILKGIRAAFGKFDEYQMAKYDSKRRTVRLRDAMFLVHPKATGPEQEELYRKLANEELPTPYTWEAEFSALGQQEFENEEERKAAFAKKWDELVQSGRLGYMALLRNLRNILHCKDIAPETIDRAAAIISDPQAVAKARQLPFRYLSAYKEIKGIVTPYTAKLLDALEAAAACTADHIPGFGPGVRITIAADVSGSMLYPVSPRSNVECYDIGLMLAMLMRRKHKDALTGIFGADWLTLDLKSDNVLANVMKAHDMAGDAGYSTNGHKVIEYLMKERLVMDKVLMFTDLQMWDDRECGASLQESWRKYKEMAPNATLYLFDLSGYGNTPVSLKDGDVRLVAGWGDRIFDVLEAMDNRNAALDAVKSIEL